MNIQLDEKELELLINGLDCWQSEFTFPEDTPDTWADVEALRKKLHEHKSGREGVAGCLVDPRHKTVG